METLVRHPRRIRKLGRRCGWVGGARARRGDGDVEVVYKEAHFTRALLVSTLLDTISTPYPLFSPPFPYQI